MKLNILTVFFFLIFLSSFPLKAQDALSEGNFMVGGGINFSFSNYEDENTDRKDIFFRISPIIGKLVKDDLMIGTGVSVANSSIKGEAVQNSNSGGGWTSNEDIIETDFGITFFVRKFWRVHGNFHLYLNPYLSYDRTDRNVTTTNASSTFYRIIEKEQPVNTFRLGASVGVFYFLNDHFSLSASLGNLYAYRSKSHLTSTEETTQETTQNTREVNQQGVSFRIANSLSSLGINYFF